MAASRPRPLSRARYTSPIAVAPSFASIEWRGRSLFVVCVLVFPGSIEASHKQRWPAPLDIRDDVDLNQRIAGDSTGGRDGRTRGRFQSETAILHFIHRRVGF